MRIDDFLYRVGDLFHFAIVGLTAIIFVAVAIAFSPILVPLALLGRYIKFKKQNR